MMIWETYKKFEELKVYNLRFKRRFLAFGMGVCRLWLAKCTCYAAWHTRATCAQIIAIINDLYRMH